jgi:hypothetical protein
LEGWSAGLTLQPFRYWLYNKTDYANDKTENAAFSSTFVVDDKSLFTPTGGGIGGVVCYGFSETWSARTELSWSIQQQYHYVRFPRIPTDELKHTVHTRLQYLRLPLFFEWNSAQRGANRLYVGMGLQASLLVHYREYIFNSYADTSALGYAQWQISVNDESHLIQKNYRQTEVRFDKTLRSDWIYRRFQWGGVMRAGVSRQIGSRYVLDIGLRGEYDFSNADNLSAKGTKEDGTQYDRWSTGIRGDAGVTPGFTAARTPTHNVRAGLEFTLRRTVGRLNPQKNSSNMEGRQQPTCVENCPPPVA